MREELIIIQPPLAHESVKGPMMNRKKTMSEEEYLRDRRSPVPSSEAVSKVMRANKGKDTSPEIRLRAALREAGLLGYRLHWKAVPGRPDIVYTRYKLAIFVNGCFWHRCPTCGLPAPKANREFWDAKLKKNMERDERKIAELEEAGWSVLVCWEHEIRDDLNACVQKVSARLKDLARR